MMVATLGVGRRNFNELFIELGNGEVGKKRRTCVKGLGDILQLNLGTSSATRKPKGISYRPVQLLNLRKFIIFNPYGKNLAQGNNLKFI